MTKKDKREDILNAAKTLIAEEGFHGAPMAMIAKKAGVGAGTIYRYFENRDMLIMAVNQAIYNRFVEYLMATYTVDKPIRERFFHIGTAMFAFYMKNPLDYRFGEQFYNSPYGVEYRREKLSNRTDHYDFCSELYDKGRKDQIIKDVPLAVFFNLAFGPIFWALRDHSTGFITLDEKLTQVIIASCWDSIKM
jgi:AcrR family transcriptional regulator